MAAYHLVYDSRHLQADCQEPGSAPEPTLGNRVWATSTLPFTYCAAHKLAILMQLASVISRLVLPFWYRLTRVVPDKGPLNVCVCVRACVCACVCVCNGVGWSSLNRATLLSCSYKVVVLN